MQATFQLEASELNVNLIDAIKKAFLGKKINITITETDSAFEEKILATANSDTNYVFEGDSFDIFTNQLLANEDVDTSAFRKNKKNAI